MYLHDVFERLLDGDETTQIEAKRSEEMGTAIIKTICAFANEPYLGGGYLVLGVVRKQSDAGLTYEVVGVPDTDKLQADLANQCCGNVFNVVIRPEMAVRTFPSGRRIVIVRIPEAHPADKPVYIRKLDLSKGAFRRIGSADHRCTDDDLAMLYNLRGAGGYDAGVIEGATLDDIDREAVREYRRARAALNESAEELKLRQADVLKAIGAAVDRNGSLQITRAGLLLFGKRAALRKLCPWARLDYIIVPGHEWVADAQNRYRAVEITMPLMLAIPRIVSLVVQDLPRSFQLKGRRTRRREIPAVPHAVIREAIVNAVMHRDYRAHTHTQIIKFSNRLEIKNAGHSLKSSESLGKPGSIQRNPAIAAVLHDSGYAETKGTGIIAMRQQMHDANLTAPIFKSDKEEDRFDVTLFTHHLLDADTVAWLGRFASLDLTNEDAKALVLVREMSYIDNAMYRDINSCDVLTASKGLQRLRDLGMLTSHGRGSSTFYTFSPAIYTAGTGATNSKGKAALSSELNSKDKDHLELTPEIIALLKRLGERGESRLVDIAVLRLCALRPLSLAQLAQYVARHPIYLNTKFVKRLLAEGALIYLHPDSPNHPRQKYVTAPLMRDIAIPGEKPKRKSTEPGRGPTLFDFFK